MKTRISTIYLQGLATADDDLQTVQRLHTCKWLVPIWNRQRAFRAHETLWKKQHSQFHTSLVHPKIIEPFWSQNEPEYSTIQSPLHHHRP